MHESRNREISLDRRIREQLVAELFNRPGLLHREIHEPPERRKINQRMIIGHANMLLLAVPIGHDCRTPRAILAIDVERMPQTRTRANHQESLNGLVR